MWSRITDVSQMVQWHPRGITEESRGIAKLLFLSDDFDLGFINGKTTKKNEVLFTVFRDNSTPTTVVVAESQFFVFWCAMRPKNDYSGFRQVQEASDE